MVNSDVSGVGFSRHPLLPVSSDSVLVEAVYGLGEGLVSGLLEADRYQVSTYCMGNERYQVSTYYMGNERYQVSTYYMGNERYQVSTYILHGK